MPGIFQHFTEREATVPGFYENFLSLIKEKGVVFQNRFLPIFSINQIIEFGTEQARRLSLTCTDVTLPSKSFQTIERKIRGPIQKVVHSELFTSEVTFSFLVGADMYERKFFEEWQNRIVDPFTKDVNYYDQYAKSNRVVIYVLPRSTKSFEDFNPAENKVYAVVIDEIYPLSIAERSLSFGNKEIMSVEVTFAFKEWFSIPQYTLPPNILPITENGSPLETGLLGTIGTAVTGALRNSGNNSLTSKVGLFDGAFSAADTISTVGLGGGVLNTFREGSLIGNILRADGGRVVQ